MLVHVACLQVHVVNTVIAWLDMLLAEQRTFSQVSLH